MNDYTFRLSVTITKTTNSGDQITHDDEPAVKTNTQNRPQKYGKEEMFKIAILLPRNYIIYQFATKIMVELKKSAFCLFLSLGLWKQNNFNSFIKNVL